MNEPIEKTVMVSDTTHIKVGSLIVVNGTEYVVTSIDGEHVEYRKKNLLDTFKQLFKRSRKVVY